ncbi:uncharacterized protein K452DRAFT_329396 [Aplosporella prunicola CBS 121167]|uniref:Peptidase A1 domain-containing protein n=1 Tax=Aplosporella prunicola CBS 121167 TaxID=1176127 RepID=A0A6A6B1A3_9PEZI|nr:uncharacterized protein K452DRAFT_329396 [Aplosporella prunicola CBS 121167]KAF2137183.1 hypothetical protein K452DRAFT_329396 [Aplosporella prunicola CBS 121167]
MTLRSQTTKAPEPYILHATDEWDGNDGAWSTFRISIGNPPQEFRLLISTSGHETWVPIPEACSQDGLSDISLQHCASTRGVESFNSMAKMIGLYDLGLDSHLNYSGNGAYGYDTVPFGGAQSADALSIDHQIVAGFATKDYYIGMLGTMIPSMSYGYTAGAHYRYRKVSGSLVLGGFDQSRFRPLNFSFAFAQKTSLQVGIQSILVSDTLHGQGLTSMSLEEGHLSVIDSTVPHMWFPAEVCDRFADAFGLTYDLTSDLYLVNSTIHDRLRGLNATVQIKIGQNLNPSENSTTISLPYSALDLEVSSSYVTNTSYYFPIRRAANDSQYVVGRALLQEAYLVVDNERGNFTLAQTIFSDPLPAQDIVTIKPPGDELAHEGPDLGNGVIAGIVVSCIAIFTALLVVLLCLRRRRKTLQENFSPYGDCSQTTKLSELDIANEIAEIAAPANDMTASSNETVANELENTQVSQVHEME